MGRRGRVANLKIEQNLLVVDSNGGLRSKERAGSMVINIPTLRGIRDKHRDQSQIEALLRQRDLDYVTYEDWRILDKVRGRQWHEPGS
jgi:hypothetical protein